MVEIVRPTVSSPAAARELLRRKNCLADLSAWCRELGFEPAAHHTLIINRLQSVRSGKTLRLAIFAPPGSAKSSYVSVAYPAWYLAQRPACIIAASHTLELAEHWGRRVRNIIVDKGKLLGIRLDERATAAARWELEDGSEYFAAGVGGALAGRRADLIIIDDPIRSREDADSESVQRLHWAWWKNDVIPRLKPGGAIVLIQTRWSEADLGGRILESEGKDWDILSLPMEADSAADPLGRKPGERLWPEWFDQGMVDYAKRDPRVWAALYQQRPAAETGNYFHKNWLIESTACPSVDSLNIYGASDYAVTKKGGDFTVHLVVGIDSENRMWILDLWRDQTTSDEWIEAFCDLVKTWHPLAWAEETGQITSSLGPYLKQRQKERQAYVFRRQFPSRYDKAVRAQAIRSRMAVEGLYVMPGAPYKTALIDELLAFPAGKHDDIVDALSLIGQMLDRIRGSDMPTDLKQPLTLSGYSSVPNRRTKELRAIDI